MMMMMMMMSDGCKQVYEKCHFCTFCGNMIRSKIARHILRVHKNEEKVKKHFKFTKTWQTANGIAA